MEDTTTVDAKLKIDSIRVLMPVGFKRRVMAMYADIGGTVSEDVRGFLEKRLEAHGKAIDPLERSVSEDIKKLLEERPETRAKAKK